MPMDSLRNTQEGGFKIELANPNDMLKLQEIIRTCWLETYPNEAAGITKEDIAARDWFNAERIERLQKAMAEDFENEHTWVVRNNKNEVVGFCRMHKATGQEYKKKVGPYAEIDKIFILPEFQKKGLGPKLMKEALEWTKDLDTRLEVVSYNTSAIEFYEKMGFKETEKIFDPHTTGLPSGKALPTIEMIRKSIQTIRQNAEQESSMSDWGLNKYAEVLGINPEEMKDKLVLDIGSGSTERFGKDAAEVGIKVVSMTPNAKEGAVTGRVQEMPFDENVFDYEVALYSVPFYLPLTKEEYTVCFKEVIRTLKPGGRAYLSPVFKNKAMGEGFVPREFIDQVLSQFSDSISYTLERVNSTDQEYRLILAKK